MSRGKKNALPFDKRGGVLITMRRLVESEAWLSLSPAAKVLITLLHVHWRHDKAIACGVREAMDKIPCAKGTAQKAFRQLEELGFIVMEDHSLFNSRTQSRARTWRLTWLPWMGKPPSNDWEKQINRGKNPPSEAVTGSKPHPLDSNTVVTGSKIYPQKGVFDGSVGANLPHTYNTTH